MGTFTPVEALDLDATAAAFGLPAVRRAAPLWAGTINSNFRLDTDAGAFFLRVNEGKREDEVAYEAALVAHLAEDGVPTPRPVASGDRPFARVGGRLLTLFPWVEGEHRRGPEVRAGDARAVGRALARLHLAPPFPERRESRYRFSNIMARFQSVKGLLPADEADDLALALEALAGRAPLPTGIIHGDLFPDNVLFEGDRLVALLDFEQASDGAFAYDLAVTLLAFCFDDDFVAERARSLVAGYAAERPLAAAERAGLWDEARVAAVRFTLTRLTDVEHNPAASPELRRAKDYRRFLARLRRLEAMGNEGLAALTG
ncbi:MAG TPA: homoserine kinase [Haliangiales bacterium]|nr:homoserine kinase [Haliangiales bacterium]